MQVSGAAGVHEGRRRCSGGERWRARPAAPPPMCSLVTLPASLASALTDMSATTVAMVSSTAACGV